VNSAAIKTLDVYFENDLVGRVYDTNPLSFEYAPQWLAHKAIQIANIVLVPGITDADSVTSFFENLLPEGALRSYLFAARKASTLFGLLHSVAGDTAGGFVLLLRIPVNVTTDSGNVTGNSGERDRWVGVARFNFMPSCFFG